MKKTSTKSAKETKVLASGRVKSIIVERGICKIKISGATQPPLNYYVLKMSESSSNACYSLALSAAINNYVVTIVGQSGGGMDFTVYVESLTINW